MTENRKRLPSKTPKTAIVIIPPEDCQEPVQRIRRAHDRSIRRWMPHITLVFPFRPVEDFDDIAPGLRAACEQFQPFELTLAEFRFFRHARNRCTIWLAPEPEQLLIRFQSSLWRVVPECDDVRNHVGGFRPHLSVGQSPNIPSRASHSTVFFRMETDSIPRVRHRPDSKGRPAG